MENTIPIIKVGDYVVIKRQKYTKLHKIGDNNSVVILGKDQLELSEIIGKEYGTTFKMIPKEGKTKRLNKLETCTETEIRNLRDLLGIQESGIDNRNLIDDGESQTLKAEDIDELREKCSGSSSEILEKIIENSKTFNSKTEYSQEKYLKKKEKKYFEFVQIRQPTIRLLAEIYYRQDADKIMGVRMDTLSQILSYSGVCGFGNFLLYESGTSGLIPAAFLNSIGVGTEAKLLHMHPGNNSQKQAVLALNFPEEQNDRCISVNVYSVLREFYQNENKLNVDEDLIEKQNHIVNDENVEEIVETPSKKIKLNDDVSNIENLENDIPKWKKENKRACELLKEKLDCLVIIAREHPLSIVKTLLPFLKSSRPLVIFSLSKEILMELYVELKATTKVIKLHLKSNWLRMYQILPDRTHPEVNMNGNSGYLLCGYKVE